jgi:predicted DCC family thiol-disulfide oxidoreductase YuxK
MPSHTPGTLLLVYDAEALRCRRLVDWVGRHDRDGLVVTFPYLNGELVRVAPELAGLEFPGRVYTLDLETREVQEGSGIVPGLLRRLPAWSWALLLTPLPGAAGLLLAFMRR